MSLPVSHSIETPILQELSAVGGGDDLRYLYERLIAYFPQISESEMAEIRNGTNKSWRNAVQKAGKMLTEKNYLERSHGYWKLTAQGRKIVAAESLIFDVGSVVENPNSHLGIQKLLAEIAGSLGFFAALEYEFYDVVWRETAQSSRLSHVFEVQHRGNLDSAFAKLKRAYQGQRSKPFLIVSDEKNLRRARQSLDREFQDLHDIVTILTFTEIEKTHRNLQACGDILPKFLEI